MKSLPIFPTRLTNPTREPNYSPTPKVVGVEITGRCQLRCHHCFNNSGPENQQELSLVEIEKILDQMLEWKVDLLRLSGGEPTIHREFRQIVEACQRRNIRIAMNTNGVYTKELLSYLTTAPIEQFLISIDGLEESNDALRGRGTFQRAFSSCQELHKSGKDVLLSCHVSASNAQDVPGLIAVAASHGLNVKLSPIRPIGRAKEELPEVTLRPEVYYEVVKEVVRLRESFPKIKILTDFDIVAQTQSQMDSRFRVVRHTGNDGVSGGEGCEKSAGVSCKAGRTMININYDGGIYPCAFFVTPEKSFSAGDVRETSLTEAWQNAAVFTPFRVHQKSSECQSCDHYGARCVGGCPAIAHFTTGHLDSHDPTCFAHLVSRG